MSSISCTNQEQSHFPYKEKMENKEKVLQKAKIIFGNLKADSKSVLFSE